MNGEHIAYSRHWDLISAFEAIEPVCSTIKTVLREHGFDGDAFGIELLLREAFSNAVKHGNRFGPDRVVDCLVRITDSTFEIEIGDEGDGFDHERGSSLAEGEEVNESGRGLIIYRLYADEICFNEKGNRVVLRKKLKAQTSSDRSLTPDLTDETLLPGTVVRLTGNLAGEIVERMRPELDEAINRCLPDTLLTIDLGAAGTVDVRGLGLIMSVSTRLYGKNACLRLVNVSDDIRSLLHAVNFHRCIKIL